VEPTYEKKLETLADLQNSEVVFGDQPIGRLLQGTTANPELVTFLEHKTLKEDCIDLRKCVERMISKRDIAVISAPFYVTYVAREMGTVDVGKTVCSLDDPSFSAGVTVLLKKGNPNLDRFNILMRRYLEAGLLGKHWTELQHRASLMGGRMFREAGGDVFFAFSVSHLTPAFVLLLLGTVLSSMVFIGELIVNSLCKRGKKNSSVRIVRVLY
jgi:hypothetical protein